MKAKDDKKSIKLPARASAWYLGSSAIAKGVGVITTPIFTRLLSGEAYGKYALYMTLLGGASVVCSAFNSGSAIYKGLKKNEDEKAVFLKGVLWISTGVSLLFCLLLFAFSPFLKLNRVLYIPLTIQLLCDGITSVFLSSARFYYKYKRVAFIGIINAILPPIISFFILTKTSYSYPARIYSLLFVSMFVAVYCLIHLLQSNNQRSDKAYLIKDAFKYSIPMLPHCISTAVTTQADKLIISSVMGASALGKYSVIFSMGSVLQFTVTAISSALSPWIIRRLEAKENNKIISLLFPMTVGYCALGLCLIAIAPTALSILAPDEYFEAFPALLPIALSIPFYFISTVVTVGIVHSQKTGYSFTISSVGTVLCVILNYMLIQRLGYLGAGLSMLICQAVTTVLSLAFISKTSVGQIIDTKKTALTVLLFLAMGIAFSQLADSVAASLYALLIPALMLVYCLIRGKELVLEKA